MKNENNFELIIKAMSRKSHKHSLLLTPLISYEFFILEIESDLSVFFKMKSLRREKEKIEASPGNVMTKSYCDVFFY